MARLKKRPENWIQQSQAEVYRLSRGKAASPPAHTGSTTQSFARVSSSVFTNSPSGPGWRREKGKGWLKSTYPEFRK